MHFVKIRLYIFCFLFFSIQAVIAFKSTVRFSDEFYAAQKYFYGQAKAKFPKLSAEKNYPEIPLRGTATGEELKAIAPLTDYFEARQKFLDEVIKYPEQLYPEIFTFLSAHPALSVNP